MCNMKRMRRSVHLAHGWCRHRFEVGVVVCRHQAKDHRLMENTEVERSAGHFGVKAKRIETLKRYPPPCEDIEQGLFNCS
jgi:hypothetical protein